jgi:hypothetical protein
MVLVGHSLVKTSVKLLSGHCFFLSVKEEPSLLAISIFFDVTIREVAAWPDDQVRRFQAFLMTLRHRREQGTREKLAAKLDDVDPSRWISLEDAEKRLGLAEA